MVANGDQLKPLRRGPDRPRRFTSSTAADPGARALPPPTGRGRQRVDARGARCWRAPRAGSPRMGTSSSRARGAQKGLTTRPMRAPNSASVLMGRGEIRMRTKFAAGFKSWLPVQWLCDLEQAPSPSEHQREHLYTRDRNSSYFPWGHSSVRPRETSY